MDKPTADDQSMFEEMKVLRCLNCNHSFKLKHCDMANPECPKCGYGNDEKFGPYRKAYIREIGEAVSVRYDGMDILSNDPAKLKAMVKQLNDCVEFNKEEVRCRIQKNRSKLKKRTVKEALGINE